ncbi:MAG TPA: hypothetical protein VIL94_06000 [Acidothermaceae bacterium]
MTKHLLQPMPLSGEFTLSTSVPTYLGSWQVSTDQRPEVAKPVNAAINAAARTAAAAVATAADKRQQAATQATTQATKAFAKAMGNPISTNPISTKALPATQGSSPRRSPA